MTDFSKADFYVGLHEKAKYVGSVLRNGSPFHTPLGILIASTEEEYLDLVDSYLKNSELLPCTEWSHLWPDSRGTDYSYFFHDEKVYCSNMGDVLFDPIEVIRGKDLNDSNIRTYPRFPLMSKYNSIDS